ncbi:ATP-binding protein [uncultured Bacteroides sp.]|uniref:ATP-binding protein n=1 Tax=uncultured Bacteroides sp. TaxID=162156 RepID=UPI0025E125C6|nr:ATP-binding protein [uncultured Bacteroides sp.]
MEQKSNVQYRAEKEYKNSREKFFLLLREIISNAIHAVLIRKSKEDNYTPELNLDITFDESQYKIELTDNGEGFNEKNRKYFEELDKKNPEKESLNFHPLGQGRLAIIFFADSAEYETVYNENGKYNKRTIPYPSASEGLFSFSEYLEEDAINNTYTKLTILINKQQTLSRAKTFFKHYSTPELFKQWFIETFFPFIISNETLVINISFNGDNFTIKKDNIEAETQKETFELMLSDENKYSFTLWLIKNNKPMHGNNPIICFARNLRANLSNDNLNYSIDNDNGYMLYLTSDFFDEYVDTKGERIDISCDDITSIQRKIDEILDERFKAVIENNQKASKRNLQNFQKKYPSLEAFVVESNIVGDKNIVNEVEIIQSAINEKSRIEKKFWNQIDKTPINKDEKSFSDSEECYKLLNSSLHIYVKHRESILKRLHSLIQRFDENGEDKPELESTVHELFINRGTTLSDSSNINHLHNLWILDDKFTTFSDTFKAKSTKSGQALSDIYIWTDDPEKTKQILIFELKSTTKAHNAGNKDESMIAQVKRYAQDFYKNPERTINWRVNTEQIQYIGIILARKSDINKELSSPYVSGKYNQIPFLEDSYYLDEEFSKDNSPKNKIPIRIELYSFEDIYELASSRNNVFFKLLKKEFDFNKDEE